MRGPRGWLALGALLLCGGAFRCPAAAAAVSLNVSVGVIPVIGPCQKLQVLATVSNADSTQPLALNWSAPAGPADLQAELLALSRGQPNRTLLTLGTTPFPNGQSIEVAVSVTNGAAAAQASAFVLLQSGVAVAYPNATLLVRRPFPALLSVAEEVRVCSTVNSTPQLLTQSNAVVRWVSNPAVDPVLPAYGVTTYGPSLRLAPFTLQNGQTYDVEATVAGTPRSAVVRLRLRVAAAIPPVAVVAGGTRLTVPRDRPLVLDASPSFAPDQAPGPPPAGSLVYHWRTCSALLAAGGCAGNPLGNGSTPVWTATPPAAGWPVGTYVAVVNVSGATGSSEANITLQVVAAAVPTARLFLASPNPRQLALNADQPLRVTSRVNASTLPLPSASWTVAVDGLELDLGRAAEASQPPSLALPVPYTTFGQAAAVTLMLAANGTAVANLIELPINYPPSGVLYLTDSMVPLANGEYHLTGSLASGAAVVLTVADVFDSDGSVDEVLFDFSLQDPLSGLTVPLTSGLQPLPWTVAQLPLLAARATITFTATLADHQGAQTTVTAELEVLPVNVSAAAVGEAAQWLSSATAVGAGGWDVLGLAHALLRAIAVRTAQLGAALPANEAAQNTLYVAAALKVLTSTLASLGTAVAPAHVVLVLASLLLLDLPSLSASTSQTVLQLMATVAAAGVAPADPLLRTAAALLAGLCAAAAGGQSALCRPSSALQSLGPGTSPNLNAVSLQPGPSLMQAASTMLAVGLLASESACENQELIQVCVTVLDPSALPGSSATLTIGGMAYFVVTFPASLPTPAGSAPVYVTLVRYRQPLYFWASGAITYSVNVTQGGAPLPLALPRPLELLLYPEAPFQAGQALACAAWDAAAGRWDTAGVAVGRTWTTGVQCFADRLGDFQPVYVPQAVAPVPAPDTSGHWIAFGLLIGLWAVYAVGLVGLSAVQRHVDPNRWNPLPWPGCCGAKAARWLRALPSLSLTQALLQYHPWLALPQPLPHQTLCQGWTAVLAALHGYLAVPFLLPFITTEPLAVAGAAVAVAVVFPTSTALALLWYCARKLRQPAVDTLVVEEEFTALKMSTSGRPLSPAPPPPAIPPACPSLPEPPAPTSGMVAAEQSSIRTQSSIRGARVPDPQSVQRVLLWDSGVPAGVMSPPTAPNVDDDDAAEPLQPGPTKLDFATPTPVPRRPDPDPPQLPLPQPLDGSPQHGPSASASDRTSPSPEPVLSAQPSPAPDRLGPFTLVQLDGMANAELRKGSPLSGLQLLVHAHHLAVHDAIRKAAELTHDDPQHVQRALEQQELAMPLWLKGIEHLLRGEGQDALAAFRTALLEMNTVMEVLLRSPLACMPWALYYVDKLRLHVDLDFRDPAPGPGGLPEAAIIGTAPVAASPLGVSGAARDVSVALGIPLDHPEYGRYHQLWEDAVFLCKGEKEYVVAAQLLTEVMNLHRTAEGGTRVGLDFGKAWVARYAETVDPIDTHFEDEWALQYADMKLARSFAGTHLSTEAQRVLDLSSASAAFDPCATLLPSSADTRPPAQTPPPPPHPIAPTHGPAPRKPAEPSQLPPGVPGMPASPAPPLSPWSPSIIADDDRPDTAPVGLHERDPGWAGLYFDLIDHARAGPPAAPPAAATAGPDPLLGLGLGLGLAGRPPGQPWAPRFLSDEINDVDLWGLFLDTAASLHSPPLEATSSPNPFSQRLPFPRSLDDGPPVPSLPRNPLARPLPRPDVMTEYEGQEQEREPKMAGATGAKRSRAGSIPRSEASSRSHSANSPSVFHVYPDDPLRLEPADKYLATTTSDRLTLDRALQLCDRWDTIVLHQGVYRPCSLLSPPAGLTLEAAKGERVVVRAGLPASGESTAMFISGADALTVRGVEFEGAVGLHLACCRHTLLDGNVWRCTRRPVRAERCWGLRETNARLAAVDGWAGVALPYGTNWLLFGLHLVLIGLCTVAVVLGVDGGPVGLRLMAFGIAVGLDVVVLHPIKCAVLWWVLH